MESNDTARACPRARLEAARERIIHLLRLLLSYVARGPCITASTPQEEPSIDACNLPCSARPCRPGRPACSALPAQFASRSAAECADRPSGRSTFRLKRFRRGRRCELTALRLLSSWHLR